MEQSPPREINSNSASKEISRLLWNPNVHYRVHNSLPLFPTLSQMNPVHILPSYFFQTHYNIIFPFILRSSEWSLLFRFSDKNSKCVSHLPMHATCPAHLILLEFITLMTFIEAPLTSLAWLSASTEQLTN